MRWYPLLNSVRWVFAHALLSVLALVFAIAAMATPDWLFAGLLSVFFFPSLLLEAVGIHLDIVENPLFLLLNSVMWVAVVYPMWLFPGPKVIELFQKHRRIVNG